MREIGTFAVNISRHKLLNKNEELPRELLASMTVSIDVQRIILPKSSSNKNEQGYTNFNLNLM